MDKIDKNGTAFFIFILVLVVIIGGGYYLIKNKVNFSENNKTYTNNNEKTKINKIDSNKDYIYFVNEEVISEEDELIYKDIVFNFESEDAKELQSDLNDLMKKKRNSLKKDNEDIIEMESIDYEVIESSKYISLMVNEYTYTSEEEKDSDDLKYYVFDLYNGKLLSNEDIMKKTNISENDIKSKIKKYISEDDNVNIDKTLNNDYSLSIGKNGKVKINFVVNSSELNYNVSIEMD